MILAGDYIPKDCRVEWCLPTGRILCNLEAPIVGENRFAPYPKAGPNLANKSLGGIQPGFVFVLANNHMMDFGISGLAATKKFLNEEVIPFAGAGDNVVSARRPMVLEEDGIRIAVISCCERQFGGACQDRPGVAILGEWVVDAIQEAKKSTDYVIVSCHAALESSPFPDPELRQFYHRLIDSGADVIHGHHAHVPQGWESYGKGIIFYGMGNFVVNPESWKHIEHHCWSVAAEVQFTKDKLLWRVFFTQVESVSPGLVRVRKCTPEEAEQHAAYMAICNQALKSESECVAYWQETCLRHFDRLYGLPLRFHAVIPVKLTFRNRARYVVELIWELYAVVCGRKYCSQRTVSRARIELNSFQCETHRHAIATALGVLLGEYPDHRTEQTAEHAAMIMIAI